MIIRIEKALNPVDCQQLINFYDQTAKFSNNKDTTGHPVVYYEKISDPDKIIPKLVLDCLEYIEEDFELGYRLYPETVILAAMGVGGHHPIHADNCKQDAYGNWVPNHTYQRDFSAIYYLNSDFDGGEIVFNQTTVIKPYQGLLLAFPSGQCYQHEVLTVTKGFRYTMPIWFTRQERFRLANLESDDG